MAKPTLTFSLFLLSSLLCSCKGDTGKQQVTGLFVFGSSLVDNGNNNYNVNSTARANYLPYGVDFPLGPSGRFSNGRNPIDVLGKLLQLPGFVPSFADPTARGFRIVHGVNFASGGSGILDETGSLSGNVTSLSQQINNFEEVTLPDLRNQLRADLAAHISRSIFVVGTGGNDYLLNYFQQAKQISLKAFTNNLLATYSRQLKKLYSLGARKFVLLSVQTLGCLPMVLAELTAKESCVEPINQAALAFNSQLKSLVISIKLQMPGSNLVYVNSYGIIRDIINNPTPKGFEVTDRACCEVLSTRGRILCKRGGITCKERNKYVFFDGLHPTDAVNLHIAEKAYASDLETEVYPINVRQLARL